MEKRPLTEPTGLIPTGPTLVDDAPPRPYGPRFFEEVLDNLYDGVYFVDTRRRILSWNRGAERLSGYSREEVVGKACADELLCHTDRSGQSLCLGRCPLARCMVDGRPSSARVYLRHRDGRRVPVDVSVMPMRDERGRIIGGVEVFRDASAAESLESAYERQRALAERDDLTGLVNRRCAQTLLASEAAAGSAFSVVIADIDHFKQINDRYGHAVGDETLIAFARCLGDQVRPTDVAARLGGEEFLLILPRADGPAARAVADRIRRAVPAAAPAALAGRLLTASFGVAGGHPGEPPDSTLARADAALYRAKAAGRDRVELADDPV